MFIKHPTQASVAACAPTPALILSWAPLTLALSSLSSLLGLKGVVTFGRVSPGITLMYSL